MDFHYNRYEVTIGTNLKYQKTELKKEEKEEPQRAVVPENEPLKPEEVMTGRENLAIINRIMINNPKGNRSQEPINIRWEHPENEDIEMVRKDYINAKQTLLTQQRIDEDDITDIEKLIEYATYLLEKDTQHSEEYSMDILMFNNFLNDMRNRSDSRGGEGNILLRGGEESKTVKQSNLRAGETSEDENSVTLYDLIQENNDIWKYVKSLLDEYGVEYVDNFDQISDGSNNPNNVPIMAPLAQLRNRMIEAGQGDILDKLKERVENYFRMLNFYHQNVENSDGEIDKNKLKHPIHFGIWVTLLGN